MISTTIVTNLVYFFPVAFYSRSRLRRSVLPDLDDFDVEGIEQLFHLLDTTVGTKTEVSV